SGRCPLDGLGGDIEHHELATGCLDGWAGSDLVLAVELRVVHDVLSDEICDHRESSCSSNRGTDAVEELPPGVERVLQRVAHTGLGRAIGRMADDDVVTH